MLFPVIVTRHALRSIQTRAALVVAATTKTVHPQLRTFSRTAISQLALNSVKRQHGSENDDWADEEREEDHQEKERLATRPEHAVISTFDLFSIGGESNVWSCMERGGN